MFKLTKISKKIKRNLVENDIKKLQKTDFVKNAD